MDNYYSGNPRLQLEYILYSCRQAKARCDALGCVYQSHSSNSASIKLGQRAQGVKHRGGTREAAHVKLPRLFALPIFVAVWYIKSPSSGHCRKIWQRSAVFCAAALAAPQIESLEKANASNSLPGGIAPDVLPFAVSLSFLQNSLLPYKFASLRTRSASPFFFFFFCHPM